MLCTKKGSFTKAGLWFCVQAEMVSINPTLLQFSMNKKGLGTHPVETLCLHINP